jgi:hypothetical protein
LFELRVTVSVDARSILRAFVAALPHALRGVVVLPEELQEITVGYNFWIEHDADDFRVPGHPAADFFIGWVSGDACGVANGGGDHALMSVELALCAPEAAEPEHRALHAGEVAVERRIEDEVSSGDGHLRVAAR